jgi:hypothetical protein
MGRRIVFPPLLTSSLLMLVTMSCSLTLPSLKFTPTSTVTPKVRDFALKDLLISESTPPLGWSVSRLPHPVQVEEGQEDSRGIEFRLASGYRMGHEVYQYQDEQTAAKRYRGSLNVFGSAERLTPWEVPEGLTYRSNVADQFRFACADFRDYPDIRFRHCAAMGQYEEFVSIFYVSVLQGEMDDYMTLSDLERILTAIDERMAHYLKSETH